MDKQRLDGSPVKLTPRVAGEIVARGVGWYLIMAFVVLPLALTAVVGLLLGWTGVALVAGVPAVAAWLIASFVGRVRP